MYIFLETKVNIVRFYTSLEAEVCSMGEVLAEVAVIRRRGTEDYFLAQVVSTFLAKLAAKAGHTGLYGHAVP